jgi:hypothetical protein
MKNYSYRRTRSLRWLILFLATSLASRDASPEAFDSLDALTIKASAMERYASSIPVVHLFPEITSAGSGSDNVQEIRMSDYTPEELVRMTLGKNFRIVLYVKESEPPAVLPSNTPVMLDVSSVKYGGSVDFWVGLLKSRPVIKTISIDLEGPYSQSHGKRVLESIKAYFVNNSIAAERVLVGTVKHSNKKDRLIVSVRETGAADGKR